MVVTRGNFFESLILYREINARLLFDFVIKVSLFNTDEIISQKYNLYLMLNCCFVSSSFFFQLEIGCET